MAKVISHTSNNPKLSMRTPVKGYAEGGIVERPAPTPAPASTDTRNAEGRGLVYSGYDTTIEAFAKAPTVGYGEAARTTTMAEVAKPSDVQYFGEEFKGEAEKINKSRWDAYNRRLENAAIRSGNVMPGVEAPKAVYSEVPKQTQKAVQLTLPKAAEKAQAPKVSSMKLTPDSLVNVTAMLSPQSKVLYKASDFIDYLNQRKKKNEV